MKRLAFPIMVFCMAWILSSSEGFSGERKSGRVIFSKEHCGLCHDRTEDQTLWGLGPSWKQIAEAYKGREDDLVRFLKGGCKPIVDESRFQIMHGEIVSIKSLSDSQIEDLVKFILRGQEFGGHPHKKENARRLK